MLYVWDFCYTAHPSGKPNPTLPSTTPVEISRIMLPDDTNNSGNVHGGTILKMIEHAGHIVANRHCNKGRPEKDPPITTALVRLEKMDFHQPMFVGEVAQLQAAVTYTSPNSLEVVVDVWAENVISGDRRHTNTAYLWYVGLRYNTAAMARSAPLRELVTTVPQLKGTYRHANNRTIVSNVHRTRIAVKHASAEFGKTVSACFTTLIVPK